MFILNPDFNKVIRPSGHEFLRLERFLVLRSVSLQDGWESSRRPGDRVDAGIMAGDNLLGPRNTSIMLENNKLSISTASHEDKPVLPGCPGES